MNSKTLIGSTGYWVEEDKKLYHVRCEPLCDWIIDYLKDYKDKQIYDFGCGNGQYLCKLQDAGFTKLIGFEAEVPKFRDFKDIRQQDLAVSFDLSEKGNCIFLEVAEHIPAMYEDIVVDNIINACDDKLIMSWAYCGQGGHGHINCRDQNEVVKMITDKGMVFLQEETNSVRNAIPDNDPVRCPPEILYFKKNVLIFKK
jgi:tryptophanyl-tRNA synthetase